jgi:hypothetical protein
MALEVDGFAVDMVGRRNLCLIGLNPDGCMLVEDERVELQELMSDSHTIRNDLNGSDKDEDVAREIKQVHRILASSFFLFGLVNNGE